MKGEYRGPMALDRVALQKRKGNFAANRPVEYHKMATDAGVRRQYMADVCDAALAKVQACMVVAGFDEMLPPLMKWLVATDSDWKRYGPGRPPRDHLEYLMWHRKLRSDRVIRNKYEMRRKGAEEREAEQKRREEAAKALEVKWRARDAKCIVPTVVAERCKLTPAERIQRRRESRDKYRRQRDEERKAAREARLARELAVEDRAFELLGRVCEALDADISRVTSDGRTAFLIYVRQVFVCVARDTSYCGGTPPYAVLAAVMGRPKAHSTAMHAHRLGVATVEAIVGVASVCARLGIDPPPYARKAGAA